MTEEGIKAHKETEQYLTWRETVADWMAKPREGMTFEVVAPEDIDSWKTLK
jgi:autoinducer 2-degrading protein